ncbi:MAG: flavodoxin, partial [Oscillospiraceae bacterium]|nr:flavodoxin [Oscillospiraceae bacterium]
IWWYREPSIIDTFIESYNFTGITVIPFCTSGGSGLGDAGKNLQELAEEANVVEGKRLTVSDKEDKLREWVKEILKEDK